jgi:3-dehydroquinate dehydratase/shikimate dehydrogenase
MPLKQSVIPHLERTDPLSAKIGAVNTISRLPDGKFYGFNTDVAGIVGPLERRLSLRNAKVLVLGAGGAGRAAVFGCRDKGAEVWILNRTPETAQKLARQSGAKVVKREALAKMTFDVIINATPAGMAGNKTASLLGPEDLNTRLVFDLVYNPPDTPLLRMARQKGLPVISGIEMFVQQGARQFEIWTGKPAPEEEMLRVVLHALRQEAGNAAAETSVPSRPARIDIAAHTPAAHADPERAATAAPPAARVAAKSSGAIAKPAGNTAAAKPVGNAAKPSGHETKPPAKPAKKAPVVRPAPAHKAVAKKKSAAHKPPAKAAAKKAVKTKAVKAASPKAKVQSKVRPAGKRKR